jgi:hypothetical protein
VVRAPCIVRYAAAVTLNVYHLLLALALFPGSPTPSAPPPCPAADASLGNLRIKVITERGKPDHIIVTGTVTNIGQRDQLADVKQSAVLLRNRIKVGTQRVPALPAAGVLDVAFTLDRPHEERALPLPLGLQLVSSDQARNDCARANSLIEKTF